MVVLPSLIDFIGTKFHLTHGPESPLFFDLEATIEIHNHTQFWGKNEIQNGPILSIRSKTLPKGLL